MSRRAQVFTIIALVLVLGLVVYFNARNRISIEKSNAAVHARVASMDRFIADVEHDVDRGLFISAMRSLIGMTEFVAENGTFVDDFDEAFMEVMLNGTLQGVEINITQESNFQDWMDKISQVGEKLDVEVAFEDLDIATHQYDPWTIAINILARLRLQDERGIAAFDYDLNVTTLLDITEFEDPLYTIMSGGKFTNTIIVTNVTDFVVGADASNLIEFANSSYYRQSTSAPSFLMRFEGNLSPSPYGIESIVNMPELQVKALEIYHSDRSSVDYVYFTEPPVASCQVNQTKDDLPWFRLDNSHLVPYEAGCS